LSGLQLAYRHESALRQEILLAAVLIPIACLLTVGAIERVLLIGPVLLALMALTVAWLLLAGPALLRLVLDALPRVSRKATAQRRYRTRDRCGSILRRPGFLAHSPARRPTTTGPHGSHLAS